MVRHRHLIHNFEATSTGKIEQALRDADAAFKPAIVPGHYNNTLGQRIAVSNKRGSTTSLKRLKSRITLPEVWGKK